MDLVVSALQAHSLVGVSDGSYASGFGTAAWIWSDRRHPELQWKGAHIVPGSASKQSAYRSELSGLYGLGTMLRLLCEYYSISTGSVEVGCDGQSALSEMFFNGPMSRMNDSDFDIKVGGTPSGIHSQ